MAKRTVKANKASKARKAEQSQRQDNIRQNDRD
jgi:hypothetical protein